MLIEIFTKLTGEIVRRKPFAFCVFQLNNSDVTNENTDKVKEILNVFRDIFHTPKTIWYLLGDAGLENLINEQLSRVSSIVRHWVHVNPLDPSDFLPLFRKRVRNSGKGAICPFTDEAIGKLAESTMGRPRFALDVAGKLIEMFGDVPIPEIIDANIVEKFAKGEIEKIAEIGNLSRISINILRAISRIPGANATLISRESNVNPGNLMKYAYPLARKNLIRIEKEGRSTLFYPVGLGRLIV